MARRSIHDNFVYAYTVLCQEQRIVLYTEYRDAGAAEYTDVIFSGVLAHHFDCVLQGNILSGIEDVEPEQIVREWANLFARQKSHGWPAVEYHDPQELISVLNQRAVKGYEIDSSYGLSGWVLAAAMIVTPRTGRAGNGE